MSPEVLSGEIVTPKADVYSFAIVLWELMTGNSPFEHHEDYGEFLKAVIDQEVCFFYFESFCLSIINKLII